MVEEKIKEKTIYGAYGGRKPARKAGPLSTEVLKSFTYDPEDEKNQENMMKRELTQNLGTFNKRVEQNTMDLNDAESLIKMCREKIRGLQTAKMILYKSILSQGMDTR